MDLSLRSLQVPLPEDIEKLKGFGDFSLAKEVIEQRLNTKIPKFLRDRLELEVEILNRIEKEYPYTRDEALSLLKEVFNDVEEREIDELRKGDVADWYYINGKLHFKSDFIANIIKTRAKWADRVKDKRFLEDKEGNFSLLDNTIKDMTEKKSLTYHIRAAMSLKINPASYKDEQLSVFLPLPVEYSQVKNLKIHKIHPEHKDISKATYPARTVYFDGHYDEEQEFYVEFSFDNSVEYIEPEANGVSPLQPSFYTHEEEPHIVFSPYIKAICHEIVGDEKNPLIKARKIYDYITTKVIYSYVRPYLTMTSIPSYCLTSLKGDCGVLALSFITICRCAGIPARWQSGLYANPLSIGNHDWAQYYIEPYGWLYADCSFGGAAYRAGNYKRWNFYAYNLDPFRIPFASEFQYPFYPEKKFLRNDPYDNQNGEAEYESCGLVAGDLITKSRLISIEKMEK